METVYATQDIATECDSTSYSAFSCSTNLVTNGFSEQQICEIQWPWKLACWLCDFGSVNVFPKVIVLEGKRSRSGPSQIALYNLFADLYGAVVNTYSEYLFNAFWSETSNHEELNYVFRISHFLEDHISKCLCLILDATNTLFE